MYRSMMQMKYEILYPEAFPIIKFGLERGERIKAESDAMISMSGTIDIKGKMEGGLLQGLARKFLAGESFFFQAPLQAFTLFNIVRKSKYCAVSWHFT